MSIKAHWGVWLAANLPRECTTTTDFSSARIAPYNFALGAHMQRVYIASAANAWWWWQTPTSSSLLHCAHDLMAGRNMSAICCRFFFYAEAIRCVDSCRRWSGYVRFFFFCSCCCWCVCYTAALSPTISHHAPHVASITRTPPHTRSSIFIKLRSRRDLSSCAI